MDKSASAGAAANSGTGTDSSHPESRQGTFFTFMAYLLWGAMALYFPLMDAAGAIEIVAHRILWSMVLCLAILFVASLRARRHTGSRMFAELRVLTWRQGLVLGIAGTLICGNWLLYVWAVNHGHVIEVALGYFINPIVTVLFGVLFLREQLSVAKWVAVGISVVAVVVLAFGYGALPWISLTLACTFGSYSLVKKQVGRGVGAVTSLTLETVWLAPFAALALLWVGDENTFAALGAGHTLLLVSCGIVTTVPLLFFGAGARRVPLTTVGLMQNITPILQFLTGLFIFHQEMPLARWVGFALVWCALAVLLADTIGAEHRRRATVRRLQSANS